MTAVWIVFAVVIALGFAAVFAAVALVVQAIGDGDPVGDVQRYLALNQAARRLIPAGPVLSDPRGETSAAIDRLLARKEQARRELWASLRDRAGDAADAAPVAPDQNRRRRPCVFSSRERAAQSAAGSFPS